MSNSLQDQLIEAGLARPESDRKPARKKRGANRRGKGQRKGRDKAGAPTTGGGAGAQANTQPRPSNNAPAAEQAAPKREPTPEERADRIRQLVRAHRIDRKYAAVPYRFTQGSRIREVAVTASQQGRIARGELGIVTDGERVELVPAKVARQVRGVDRDAVLVLNSGRASDDEAEHPVPDDLMW